MKQLISLLLVFFCAASFAQQQPLVNQAGYNLGEAKRFVCPGASDGTAFTLVRHQTGEMVFRGEILHQQGWFTTFNPMDTGEFRIEVGGVSSHPFWIADHLIEKVSTRLAYEFFIDVRGCEDPRQPDLSGIYGGGPSRDGGAYGLETVFECLLYASNPSVFDRWTTGFGDPKVPDLIELILWHAEFAYAHVAYQGPVANRHGSLGYEGQAARMQYDYWNLLDQLAAVCAAYHEFLHPYLPRETYLRYRRVCLEKWQTYERHKVLRYWTYSTKWVDAGFQEFNEMGNAYGQSVFRNLFMYLSESREPGGNPEPYLRWAQDAASDIIHNWDFSNPRHMWWIRNAEHITPQALAFFLLAAPRQAPAGAREKLEAWALHMHRQTSNFWKYRVHSETEWAHPRTKELGGAPALGGSMFAVAHLLGDSRLRATGWAQVDFVFGINPLGVHLSNKSPERLEIGGYWDGVEQGWPVAYPHGYGQLGRVRGTLDGSPLDKDFQATARQAKESPAAAKDLIGSDSYATEGWCISNRGWMATLTFSTLGSHELRFINRLGKPISQARSGEQITVELKAALNFDWTQPEKGQIWVKTGSKAPQTLQVLETGPNTGLFRASITLPADANHLTATYGFLGLSQQISLTIQP